jgi:hypothetical protein
VFCIKLLKVDFLNEKVAVATLDGKAYFFIVNQLREQNVPFVSLVPGDQVPAQIKVVVTTPEERNQVNIDRAITFTGEETLDDLTIEIKRILQGKEAYEKIIIGLDPGVATGLAIIADGNIVEVENCFSSKEVIKCITKTIKNINFDRTSVWVKIGNGVPIYKDLLEALDQTLPPQINLEVVSERGTNKPLKENKRSRGVRHISSAIRIAGRSGCTFARSKIVVEGNGTK